MGYGALKKEYKTVGRPLQLIDEAKSMASYWHYSSCGEVRVGIVTFDENFADSYFGLESGTSSNSVVSKLAALGNTQPSQCTITLSLHGSPGLNKCVFVNIKPFKAQPTVPCRAIGLAAEQFKIETEPSISNATNRVIIYLGDGCGV